MLISDAATLRKKGEERVIMVNDVSRAFFEAPARRIICVELPEESRGDGEEEVGLLQMSLYGTRDAAANFQAEIKKMMEGAGFTQNKYNASTYRHKVKDLKVLVHGDDFVTSGGRSQVLVQASVGEAV